MWRFIRRVFVLLVLFAIIFVIYRYINPVGASNFVEKLKSVPQYVSNMFDWWSELIIVDETISMTWDMKLEAETWNNINKNLEDEKSEKVEENDDKDSMEDNTRLEELNKEIEGILWKSETSTWGGEWNLNIIEESLEDDIAFIWDTCTSEWDRFDPKISTNKCCDWLESFDNQNVLKDKNWIICYDNNKWYPICKRNENNELYLFYPNGPVLWSNECVLEYVEMQDSLDEMKPSNIKTWSAVKGLSDLDYEQIKNVFGNLVE